MASAPGPPRVPKPKGVPPSHYYESFLEKKGPRDQEYKKFWAGLQGLTICFYNSNRDFQPLEKLDLRTFVKLTDSIPHVSSRDSGIHFTLTLRTQDVKFKAESLESREMWKGCILTVVELRVPTNLNLLPGHLYMMAGVLAKEEARRTCEVPSCFLKVSRLEAQLLLERYPECGNLLLRPSGDGTEGGFSVTTRQMLNGVPVVRHYKVKPGDPKYVIDVEDPFPCASLDAVVNYFVSQTKRALVPFLLDEDYEKVLGYVDADKENGESLWVAPSAPGPGPVIPASIPKPPPPVPVPVSSQDKLPPIPPLPPPPIEDENYVVPIEDTPAVEYVNQDVSSCSRPAILKPKKLAKLPVKPPKPPITPKPVVKSVPARNLVGSSPQALVLATRLGDVTAELEEKLQKRRALEQ
ncbi:signal-transducing adaptor protein 2 isoform X2 [Perognathus longimembris pacificus]|uniref:signal-transducing adaptor protein 2 isoform X2 n=1 Tax=Perognathus longimembris pacificus TaxID=214514 RepID=UPI00201A10B3|nr:signal-transducing adaptor protein 2 isoform X2 [Perognathus longimembris pacificus]